MRTKLCPDGYISWKKTFQQAGFFFLTYLQIQLHPKSCEYVTINTHKCLYQYTQLPFGVASAPALFQRTIEGILQGISRLVVYIDDI